MSLVRTGDVMSPRSLTPSSLTEPSPATTASPPSPSQPSPRPSTTPRADDLPASVGRTLARLEGIRPQDARDAAQALAVALEPVARSGWPEVAWRSSTLTGTGMPAEFAWSSRDVALRWTCEAAGPEVPESQRLVTCGDAAAALAGAPVELASWAPLQQGRPLRWGAWLGLRHLDAARRAKVYVELPANTVVPGPWAQVGERLTRLVPGLRWRMAGCNDDGSVELYARVSSPTVTSLASVAGVVDDPGLLVGLVGMLLRRGGGSPGAPRPAAGSGHGLPTPSGVSVLMADDGTPMAVSWFAFAKTIWSSDAATAEAVTGLLGGPTVGPVAAAPDSLALYQALLSGEADGRWRHGMVGVGVDRTGSAWLQAGVRPT